MFTLPALPYDFNALEPSINAHIMELHYTKHHQTYATKLNEAIAGTEWEQKTIEEILKNLDSIPENIRTAVRNHGGGYHNHNLFWENLTPTFQNPSENLQKIISENFESFDNFKTQFNQAATTVFGSGWAWLVQDASGKLQITKTPNQDSPLTTHHLPILGLDVWEHAYYLQYENRRPEYIDAFWNIVNWEVVEKRIG